MTISKLYDLIKKIRVSEIVLAALLFLSVWENRPPVIYVNRTKGTKGEVLYNICAKHHRWGTTTNCAFAGLDYDGVNKQAQAFVQQLDNMSVKATWRSY